MGHNFNFVFGQGEGEERESVGTSRGLDPSIPGYCIYMYGADERWAIKTDHSNAGFQCQEPEVPGQFEGQLRATICIPEEEQGNA